MKVRKIYVVFFLFVLLTLSSCVVQEINLLTNPTVKVPLGNITFEMKDFFDDLVKDDETLQELLNFGDPISILFNLEDTINFNELIKDLAGDEQNEFNIEDFLSIDLGVTPEIPAIDLKEQLPDFNFSGTGNFFEIPNISDLIDGFDEEMSFEYQSVPSTKELPLPGIPVNLDLYDYVTFDMASLEVKVRFKDPIGTSTIKVTAINIWDNTTEKFALRKSYVNENIYLDQTEKVINIPLDDVKLSNDFEIFFRVEVTPGYLDENTIYINASFNDGATIKKVEGLKLEIDPIEETLPENIIYAKFEEGSSIDILYDEDKIDFNITGEITFESTNTEQGMPVIYNVPFNKATADLSGIEIFENAIIKIELTEIDLEIKNQDLDNLEVKPVLENLIFEQLVITLPEDIDLDIGINETFNLVDLGLGELASNLSFVTIDNFEIAMNYQNNLPLDIILNINLMDIEQTKTFKSSVEEEIKISFNDEILNFEETNEIAILITADVVGLDKENNTLTINNFNLKDFEEKFGFETTVNVSNLELGAIGLKNFTFEEPITFSLNELVENIDDYMEILENFKNISIDTLNSNVLFEFENIPIELEADISIEANFTYTEEDLQETFTSTEILTINISEENNSQNLNITTFITNLINNFINLQGENLEITVNPVIDKLNIYLSEIDTAQLEEMNIIYDLNVELPLKFIVGEGEAFYDIKLNEFLSTEEEAFNLISIIKEAAGDNLNYAEWLKNLKIEFSVENDLGITPRIVIKETITENEIVASFDGEGEISISLEEFLDIIIEEMNKDEESVFDLEIKISLPQGEHQLNYSGQILFNDIFITLVTDINYSIEINQ